jgi:hypothetical protein
MNRQSIPSKNINKTGVACGLWLLLFSIVSCTSNMPVTPQGILTIPTEPTESRTAQPTLYFIPSTITMTFTEDELRQRWLNEIPCAPPCWEGVTPGVTTATEAEGILRVNTMFTRLDTLVSPLPGVNTGFINFRFIVVDDTGTTIEWGGDMLFDSKSESQYIYIIRNCFPPTRLSELIAAFGEPSHVNALYDDQRTPNTWQLYVIWMSLGLQMRAAGETPYPVINENLEFFSAEYFQPGLEGYARGMGINWVGSLVEWKGYADFELYGITMWEAPTVESLP